MCGIAGITGTLDRQQKEAVVEKMTSCMAHRGPDAGGYFSNDFVALGHRRLSIIDLSETANQPMTDREERFTIIFNGEIYNYREVKNQLVDYNFKTVSDTEVIIAAYARWGVKSLNKLKGMFAFAIWDRQEEELFIARDRFGVKPLYYHQNKSNNTFLFSSEIRSILSSGLVKRDLDQIALSDYLKYQSVVAPRTLVKDILQLPAGHWMKVKQGKIDIQSYWNPADRKMEIDTSDLQQVKKRIRDLLFTSVEQRMISDVPLGAFLSGGIDSSAIVAIMSQVSNTRPNAFTVAFEEKEFDESAYAKIVADKFNVHHTSVLLKGRDFLDQAGIALDAMDTPSGDGLNTYVVSKAIRKSGITVALSGIGGDELFVGYPIFKQFADLKKREGVFKSTKGVRELVSRFIPSTDQRSERIKGILSSSGVSIENIYPLLRRIQTNSQLNRLTNLNGQLSSGTLEDILSENASSIARFDPYSQISIAEYLGYTQHVLLKDTDQMAMASSLEVREPFFDHELVEYVLNLPDSIKQPVYPKSLLVESLKPLIPDEVVFRKKQGFVLPYDVWIRKELKDFSEEKINNLAKREFMNGKNLLEYWEQFLQHKSAIRSSDIWILIVLEHWLERNHVN